MSEKGVLNMEKIKAEAFKEYMNDYFPKEKSRVKDLRYENEKKARSFVTQSFSEQSFFEEVKNAFAPLK